MVAVPDIKTKAIGAVGFPARSVADDKTDKLYVPIPMKAIVLFFMSVALLHRR